MQKKLHTVGDLIKKSADYLEKHEIETPRLDAELLLANVLNCDRLALYMDWSKPLVELEVAAYRDAIRQRGADRIPVSRIIGKKEFFGRSFPVHSETLVPRPETEGLVEYVLELLGSEEIFQTDSPRVFDVGTGSGCIIITLALEHGTGKYYASDCDPKTLARAKENAKHFNVAQRIDFREGSILAGYEGSLHMIVSNPPYIRSEEVDELPREVKNCDPRLALDGGAEGLDVFQEILKAAEKSLLPGGWLAFEMGEDQHEEILGAFKQNRWIDEVRSEEDLSGRHRYYFARKRL